MDDTYTGKGMKRMLYLHPPDARESAGQSAMCDAVSANPGRRGGTMGDRSCQLPRMPLPDFVIALTFVLGVK